VKHSRRGRAQRLTDFEAQLEHERCDRHLLRVEQELGVSDQHSSSSSGKRDAGGLVGGHILD
jgi:hypothetical protein